MNKTTSWSLFHRCQRSWQRYANQSPCRNPSPCRSSRSSRALVAVAADRLHEARFSLCLIITSMAARLLPPLQRRQLCRGPASACPAPVSSCPATVHLPDQHGLRERVDRDGFFLLEHRNFHAERPRVPDIDQLGLMLPATAPWSSPLRSTRASVLPSSTAGRCARLRSGMSGWIRQAQREPAVRTVRNIRSLMLRGCPPIHPRFARCSSALPLRHLPRTIGSISSTRRSTPRGTRHRDSVCELRLAEFIELDHVVVEPLPRTCRCVPGGITR